MPHRLQRHDAEDFNSQKGNQDRYNKVKDDQPAGIPLVYQCYNGGPCHSRGKHETRGGKIFRSVLRAVNNIIEQKREESEQQRPGIVIYFFHRS